MSPHVTTSGVHAPADPVRRLHAEIAAVNPDNQSRLEEHLSERGISTAVISTAWDREFRTRLDWEVYEEALTVLKASDKQRHRVRQLFQVAAEAPMPSFGDRRRRREESVAAVRTAQRILNAVPVTDRSYLDAVTTEKLFMEHLNSLKVRSGLSLRLISRHMSKVDPQAARASSTLHALFQSDTVPGDVRTMRALLVVLIASLPMSEFGDNQEHQVLDDHLALWRSLINNRHRTRAQPPVDPLRQLLGTLADATAKAEAEDAAEMVGLLAAQQLVRKQLDVTSR
jgi:hypothetical protein